MELKCTVCGVRACGAAPGTSEPPDFCPMSSDAESAPTADAAPARILRQARAAYDDLETRKIALAAAQTEADRYPLETRVEEVMSFARRLGVDHLGIATCAGLLREARLAHEIFESQGFAVQAVCCKVGSIPKEEIGVADEEKIHPGQYEALCSPIGQAMLLNEAGTGLNVLIGLCVGHDSLFFRHSEAPVTVLVAKDRVTGHNPAAVLYTSRSYYRRVRE